LTVIETQAEADAAVADITNIVADVVAGGSSDTDTFTLTNGTDIKTASTFIADMVYTPAGNARINSLQDEDQLTGTAGTADKLDATLGTNDANVSGAGGTTITPKMAGIETIDVAFTGSGAQAVN